MLILLDHGKNRGGIRLRRIQKNEGKVNVGMKGRLLALILPNIVAVILITLFISLYNMKGIVEERTKEIIEYTTKGNVASMDAFLGATLKELDAMKLCIKNSYLTEAQLKRLFQNTYGTNEFYPEGLYYASSEGFYANGKGEENQNGVKIIEEQWFLEGLEHKDGFSYGVPYIKENTGDYVVTASIDLSTGPVKKVMAADIPMTILMQYVEQISFLEGQGRTLLVNTSTGEVLSQINTEERITSLLLQKVIEGAYETSVIKQGGMPYYATVSPLSYCNLALVSYVSQEKVVLSELRKVIIEVCIIVAVLVALSLLLIERYINHKTSQLKRVTNYMDTITKGDFSKEMKKDSNDEMGMMIDAVSNYRSVMIGMIKDLIQIGQQLRIESKTSNQMGIQLSDASSSQHDSMELMQQSLTDLSASVEEIVTNANTLSLDIGEVREKSQVMNSHLGEMTLLSDAGQSEITEMGDAMIHMEETMESLAESVHSVHHYMTRIKSMVDSMEEIAEQSKLLSLNAAIEAVRANSDGKGFQVVAMEVNALAKNSADSVIRMKQVIEGIVSLVGEMKGKTEHCVAAISDSKMRMQHSITTFQGITSKAESVKEEVEAVTCYIKEVEGVSQNLVAITQEQSASSQQMFSMSDMVLEQTKQLNNNATDSKGKAEELGSMVMKLQEVLGFFQLS